MLRNWNLIIILLAILVAGCAAMGVPYTTDPKKKLSYAVMLYDEQQRPLPAERLIRESIDIFKSENNEKGLAQAYRVYGFFFRSAAIKSWHRYYKRNGFMEDGASFANRYDKSIEYFEKSEAIFKKHNIYDALTNVYLHKGFTYEFAKKNKEACEEYKKSIVSHQNDMKTNPGVSVTLPEGFNSYGEYIGKHMQRLGCT